VEKVVLVCSAILLVAYFIFTETLDWVGRIEVIRDHFPKFPEFLERRIFRIALLVVAIILLIRVATERDDKKVEIGVSPNPTAQAAPATEPKKNAPVPSQPDVAPQIKPIPAAKPAKRPSLVESNPINVPTIGQSNSGGVNVQQATTGKNSPIVNSPVTIGSVPKHIAPQDELTLTDYLLKTKASAARLHIVIAADQYSRPSPFVDEFYGLFKNGQWPMRDGGVTEFMGFSAPAPKKFQGAVVVIKGEPIKPGETVNIAAPDPVFYIGTVLNTLKITRSLTRDPNAEQGLIIIQFEGGFPAD